MSLRRPWEFRVGCKIGKKMSQRFTSQRDREIIYNYKFSNTSKEKEVRGLDTGDAWLKFKQAEANVTAVLVT